MALLPAGWPTPQLTRNCSLQSHRREGSVTALRSLHTCGWTWWPRVGLGPRPEIRDPPHSTGSNQGFGPRGQRTQQAGITAVLACPRATGFPSSAVLVLDLPGVVVSCTKASSATDLATGEGHRVSQHPSWDPCTFVLWGHHARPMLEGRTGLNLGLRSTTPPKFSPLKKAVLTLLETSGILGKE